MREDITSEIKSGIKDKYFLIMVIALIVLFISFLLGVLKFTIISSIFLFIAGLFYITKSEIKPKGTSEKLFLWATELFLLATIILLILQYLQKLQLISLIAYMYVLVLYIFVFSFIILRQLLSLFWESRDPTSLIIFYILVVCLLISIFGSFFSILSDWDSNGLKCVIDDSKVSDFWSCVYFSAQTFYSTNFGDIAPLGYSRMITVMEMIFSAILHVIILGLLVPTILELFKKSKKRKK